jgi:hypothetical protein
VITLPVGFAVVFSVALLFWLGTLIRHMISKTSARESWLAGSTLALSVVLAAFGVLGRERANGPHRTAAVMSCGRIDERTAADAITQRLGKPSRVVTEADSRGPGAEAWVYEDRRCVVHLLDKQVDSVEYE